MIYYPDKTLKKISEPVTEVNEKTLEILAQMKREMQEHDGVGISAIQIGVPLRMFFMKDTIMINPDIRVLSLESTIEEESCLSIPNVKQKIERPGHIAVKYMNLFLEYEVREYKGLESRIIQHELDHLNGKVILDKLSNLKRIKLIKSIAKKRKSERLDLTSN